MISTALKASVWLVVIAAVLVACGDAGSEDESSTACGGPDHPCTFSEVPVEVIERTLELGEETGAILAQGGDTAEAAETLGENEDVVGVRFDEDAIRFRVEGGRELWVFAPSSYATRSGVGRASPRETASAALPLLGDVVGADHDAKRAIVLSPTQWDFGDDDEGAAVASILAATRGYEGRVTHLANAGKSDDTVGIEQYKNLDGFDVVHISTHGSAVCDEQGCAGVILAFSFDSIEASLPGTTPAQKFSSYPEVGVGLGMDPITGDLGVVLTADFFAHHYPGGIGDAVVFVNACETMAPAGVDLVSAVKGADSVYIGWDASVRADYAAEAATALFGHLAETGTTVDDARAEIGALATPADGAVLGIAGRTDGHEIRIREVVRLLDPGSLDPLAGGAEVRIAGDFGDGEDDAVPYAVAVDGIAQEDVADAQLRVTIDGVEHVRPVSSGTLDDGDRWLVEGELELGYDLTEKAAVDIEAVVELPEGGESDDTSTIGLVGEVEGAWSLEVEFTHTSFREGEASEKSSGSARLALEENEFQPFDDQTSYRIVGGSATLDLNYESPLCIQTGPVLTWDVTEEDAAASFVTIDRSTDPATLTANVSIQGPEFAGEIRCRAGTGADAPPGYGEPEPTSFGTNPLFLSIASDDAQPIDATAPQSTGTVILEATGDFGSIREMSFVLTRSED